MDIDMMRKQGMCFNCGVKGHITTRCPEPKKERKFFERRIEQTSIFFPTALTRVS